MKNGKMLGMVVAAFVAGAFIASPELRAYAANTVGSGDIINESILSADIKNGEVKAADIATDAVGAAELQGVTKLLFGQCKTDAEEAGITLGSHTGTDIDCSIAGVDGDDSAIAFLNKGNSCLHPTHAIPRTGAVQVFIVNWCPINITVGDNLVSVVVYDK